MITEAADGPSWLRILLAFVIVCGLLGGLGFVLKFVAARGIKLPNITGRGGRLSVVETLPLDLRRRLVLVRCDDREHLLLLGNERDVVVSTDVAVKKDSAV